MPIDPQGSFDWLLGTSREKYTLAEVARILSADADKPVSTTAVINAIESGQLRAVRVPLSAVPGQEQRYRVQWVSRLDLLAYLLRNESVSSDESLRRLADTFTRLSPEALRWLGQQLTAELARRPAARRAI